MSGFSKNFPANAGRSFASGELPLWRQKLNRCPVWADAAEPETAKRAAWFADVRIQPHPKWEGVTEVVCPNACVAEWMIEGYLMRLVGIARREVSGTKRVLVRPENLGKAKIAIWCQKSGMGSIQAMADPIAIERVTAWMSKWRSGGLGERELESWQRGEMPA